LVVETVFVNSEEMEPPRHEGTKDECEREFFSL